MAADQEEAYRAFYDAYYWRLWRYLLVVSGGNEDAAAEALQATLVRVVRHIKVFSDETVFWSWLTVLARSAFADQGRKRRRYLAFLDRFARQTPSLESGPDELETDGKLLALLEQNLAQLPLPDRQLVESKYLERRPVREIAEQLETSEKAIESRLVRVRRRLKESLLKELRDE
jgi:RNA polymerase sigma-70 factor, ECF subfamily